MLVVVIGDRSAAAACRENARASRGPRLDADGQVVHPAAAGQLQLEVWRHPEDPQHDLLQLGGGKAPTPRGDRILDEAHAPPATCGRVADLFGLSIHARLRYTSTVDPPDLVQRRPRLQPGTEPRRRPHHRPQRHPPRHDDPVSDTVRPGFRTVFAHSDYRRLFYAQTISRSGDTIAAIAVVVLAFQLTGSGLGVTGVVLAADRPAAPGPGHDRRRPGADGAGRGAAAPRPAHPRHLRRRVRPFRRRGFFNPASASALPGIVDERELLAANSGLWSAAVIAQIALAPCPGSPSPPGAPPPPSGSTRPASPPPRSS